MAEIEQETPDHADAESLSAALGSAFDEAFSGSDEAEQPEQQAAPEGEEPAGQPEQAEQPEQPEQQAAPEEPAGGEKPAEGTEELQPIPPPQHWPAEQQEEFAKLTPKSQQFMLDAFRGMEAGHTRRSQEIAPMRAAAARWAPYLQQTGDTPDRAFDTLMQTERTLRTGTPAERREVVLGIIHKYGVEFGGANGNGNGNGDGAQPDDRFGIRKMVNEAVAGSDERFRRLEGQLRAREQAEAQARGARLQGVIRDFVDAKGPDGKPSHPHVQQVWREMGMIAETIERHGGVPDIADCYDKACRLNPAVWEKIETSRTLAAQSAKRRDEQERARKAKVAAGGLGGAGGGGVSMPSDIDEQLGRAWDEAFAS